MPSVANGQLQCPRKPELPSREITGGNQRSNTSEHASATPKHPTKLNIVSCSCHSAASPQNQPNSFSTCPPSPPATRMIRCMILPVPPSPHTLARRRNQQLFPVIPNPLSFLREAIAKLFLVHPNPLACHTDSQIQSLITFMIFDITSYRYIFNHTHRYKAHLRHA